MQKWVQYVEKYLHWLYFIACFAFVSSYNNLSVLFVLAIY